MFLLAARSNYTGLAVALYFVVAECLHQPLAESRAQCFAGGDALGQIGLIGAEEGIFGDRHNGQLAQRNVRLLTGFLHLVFDESKPFANSQVHKCIL